MFTGNVVTQHVTLETWYISTMRTSIWRDTITFMSSSYSGYSNLRERHVCSTYYKYVMNVYNIFDNSFCLKHDTHIHKCIGL